MCRIHQEAERSERAGHTGGKHHVQNVYASAAAAAAGSEDKCALVVHSFRSFFVTLMMGKEVNVFQGKSFLNGLHLLPEGS